MVARAWLYCDVKRVYFCVGEHLASLSCGKLNIFKGVIRAVTSERFDCVDFYSSVCLICQLHCVPASTGLQTLVRNQSSFDAASQPPLGAIFSRVDTRSKEVD